MAYTLSTTVTVAEVDHSSGTYWLHADKETGEEWLQNDFGESVVMVPQGHDPLPILDDLLYGSAW